MPPTKGVRVWAGRREPHRTSALECPPDDDGIPDWWWHLLNRWISSRAFFTIRDSVSLSNVLYDVGRAFPQLDLSPTNDPDYMYRQLNRVSQSGKRKVTTTAMLADRSDPSYEYQALAKDHIRLLTLQPASHGVGLHAALHHYSIHSLPEYQALSYTWGNSLQDKIITIEGKALAVHANAFAALHELQAADEPTTLWVDAICINQADVAERGSQVQLMRQIYTNAVRVPIWIGLASDASKLALALVTQLSSLRITEGDDRTLQTQLLSAQHLGTAWEGEKGGGPLANLPEREAASWKALNEFFWSAWFSRVWIIQEVSLAREAVVVCGGDACSWADVKRAAEFIADHSLALVVNVDPMPVLRLCGIMDSVHGQLSLLGLMQLARRSRSSDPRDKMYALMGIAPNGSSIVPDYSVDVVECFIDFALSTMKFFQNLSVLNAVEHWAGYVTEHRDLYDLPSWAPKWTLSGLTDMLPKTSHVEPSPQMYLTQLSTTAIEVYGLSLATVSKSGSTFCEYVPWLGNSVRGDSQTAIYRSDLISIHRWCQWETMARLARPHRPTDETMVEYIKTILAGNIVEARSEDDEYLLRWYKSWVVFWRYVGIERGRLLGYYASRISGMEFSAAMGFMRNHKEAAYGRRFVVTNDNRFGLCPYLTRNGDRIVVLAGGLTPYVLRKQGTFEGRRTWKVLGECHLQGLRPDIMTAGTSLLRPFVLV